MTALTLLTVEARRLGRPIALDTVALIAYLEDRAPFASYLEPIVESFDVPVVFSAITLAEVLVLPARRGDHVMLERVRSAIAAMPAATVVPFDDAVAVEAALVRATTGLKLPDAAIIATAKVAGALAVVGNDREWRSRELGLSYVHLDDLVD